MIHAKDRLIKVRIPVNNDRVFSTHLRNDPFDKRAPLCRDFGRGGIDGKSYGSRTCEGDQGHIGMMDKTGTYHLSLPLKQVDDTIGKPDLAHHLHEQTPHQARLLRGFDDNRVSSGQSRCGHACQNRKGKIPGCNHARNPSRGIGESILFPSDIRPLRTLHLHSTRRIESTKVDCLTDVIGGFTPRLSTLKHLPS